MAGGYDESKISGRLGQPYFMKEPGISIKPYPSGSLSHPAQDLVLDLVRQHDLKPADIEHIDVGTNSNVPNALIYPMPKNALEGKFSIPFCMAPLPLWSAKPVSRQFTDRKVRDRTFREDLEAFARREGYTLSRSDFGRFVRELLQPANFADQAHRVDHHAVADNTDLAPPQDARGDKMENEFLLANEDRVAGVVAALSADHHVGLAGEHVDDFAFAFVAPLGADENSVGHSFRRAMKKAIQTAMDLGAEGIKIRCGGRLGGAARPR